MAQEYPLAIAAASFAIPSETFIRDHVRICAPGQTVLVCQDAAGTAAFACPVLDRVSRAPEARSLTEKSMVKAMALWGLVHEPGLYGVDRRRVADFLVAHRVRAVLAEYGNTGVNLIGPCRDAGVRLYVHFHGFDATLFSRRWFWRRRYRLLFRAAAGVIVPSRFLAGRLRALGCDKDKLHVSPNGVDPRRFRQTRREPGRVVAVGRLVEKKGPELTLRAFARVLAHVPAARLDLVGDGELRGRCEAVVCELGLADTVTLHGVQPPEVVAQLMGRASIFAQHSVTAANGDMESFGIVLAEAQACSLPVVATRHNGFPETIVDGETGILVDEHDVAGMAAAMVALLTDPTRATAMGQAGRQRVLANFTHERLRHRLLAIMELEDLLVPIDGVDVASS